MLFFLLGRTMYISDARIATNAIQQCEAELPRNQTCTVIAIPTEKTK